MRIPRRIPIDRCAWPLLAGLAGLSGLALLNPWRLLVIIPIVLTALVAFFFRDPERRCAAGTSAFVSPADGVVTAIRSDIRPDAELPQGPCISIFLAVWNVHVNRTPHDGVVESVRYVPGGHTLAWQDAAAGNESNWVYFRSGRHRIVVRQVAGKVARRVVCRLRKGEAVRKGQRLGIIKFGSRTDLYLPAGSRILVRSGDKVYGGVSILALAPEEEARSPS